MGETVVGSITLQHIHFFPRPDCRNRLPTGVGFIPSRTLRYTSCRGGTVRCGRSLKGVVGSVFVGETYLRREDKEWTRQ